jgi:hypothetical protein
MVKSLQNQETAGMESDRDIETASGGSNTDDVSANIEMEVGVVEEEEA